ncbi:MAG: rhodanese-like domain-containing protein [Ruminiclostridium sp.]|nr:rhodanese-like domain-containing protein [Ruminiclostridium sp.]
MLKRILPLLLVLVIMLAGCGKSDADTPNNAYEKITMSEGLARMESDENYILLDVRRADEFEAGHIPGAVNLPNEEIGTEEIPSLPDKAQTIYIYCRSGNRSKQAADKLLALGYTNLIEFGGIIDYTGELEYGK